MVNHIFTQFFLNCGLKVSLEFINFGEQKLPLLLRLIDWLSWCSRSHSFTQLAPSTYSQAVLHAVFPNVTSKQIVVHLKPFKKLWTFWGKRSLIQLEDLNHFSFSSAHTEYWPENGSRNLKHIFCGQCVAFVQCVTFRQWVPFLCNVHHVCNA